MADLHVIVDGHTLEADWVDEAPATRASLETALPLSGDAVRWGDELYIDVPLEASPENATEVVQEGAIAYWPAGCKLCLFWGPTPASHGDEPRAAAPVTVVARLGDTEPLSALEGGARMRVEAAGTNR